MIVWVLTIVGAVAFGGLALWSIGGNDPRVRAWTHYADDRAGPGGIGIGGAVFAPVPPPGVVGEPGATEDTPAWTPTMPAPLRAYVSVPVSFIDMRPGPPMAPYAEIDELNTLAAHFAGSLVEDWGLYYVPLCQAVQDAAGIRVRGKPSGAWDRATAGLMESLGYDLTQFPPTIEPGPSIPYRRT